MRYPVRDRAPGPHGHIHAGAERQGHTQTRELQSHKAQTQMHSHPPTADARTRAQGCMLRDSDEEHSLGTRSRHGTHSRASLLRALLSQRYGPTLRSCYFASWNRGCRAGAGSGSPPPHCSARTGPLALQLDAPRPAVRKNCPAAEPASRSQGCRLAPRPGLRSLLVWGGGEPFRPPQLFHPPRPGSQSVHSPPAGA